MRKICIIIDHPTRDLPGNLILAKKFIEKNNKVYLIPSRNIEECLLLKPDLVIANYARPVYENFFKLLKIREIDLCIVDTEGAPFGKENSHYKYYPKSVLKYLDYIKVYFLWGRDQFNLIRKFSSQEKNIYKKKLIVSGTPMFDYHKIIKKKKIKKKKIILVNTGLSIANPRFTKDYKNEIKNAMKEAHVSKGVVLESYKAQKKILKNFISFIKKLSISINNNYKIILNPHPFEKFNTYKHLLGDRKNIIIFKQNNIVPVINYSDIIFSINCQTSIDSLLLNKPTFNLAFLNKEIVTSPVLSKSSIQINSFKNCLDLIKNFSYHEKKYLNQISKNKKFLSLYFNNFKSKSSNIITKFVLNKIKKKNVKSTFFDYLFIIYKKNSLINLVKVFLIYLLAKLNLRKYYLKPGFDKKRYEKEIGKHLRNIDIKKRYKFKNTSYSVFNILNITLNSYEIY